MKLVQRGRSLVLWESGGEGRISGEASPHGPGWLGSPDDREAIDATASGARTDDPECRGILEESPSLRRELPEVVEREYPRARAYAADETGLSIEGLPEGAPFGMEQMLDEAFLPG